MAAWTNNRTGHGRTLWKPTQANPLQHWGPYWRGWHVMAIMVWRHWEHVICWAWTKEQFAHGGSLAALVHG